MKTYVARSSELNRKWLLIDAENLVLGRLSVILANYVRGKHKPCFTPSTDCGDNVVVINSDKIRLTGKKMTEKIYVRHTGYPGGQRTSTPKEVMGRSSTRLIEGAVRGMLPKNRLGRSIFKNLFVYEGAEHPHKGQQPKEI